MKKKSDLFIVNLMWSFFYIMVPVAMIALVIWVIVFASMLKRDYSKLEAESVALTGKKKVMQETPNENVQKPKTEIPKVPEQKVIEDSIYDADGILIKKPTKSVKLKNLYNINHKQKFFRTKVSDTLGHTYDEACLLDYDQYDFDNHGAVLFEIHGDEEWFTTFRSKVVAGVYKDGYRHAGKQSNKIIFTDENDNVLYESGDISETTEPFLAEFDITGVRVLKIKADSTGAILLLNPLLIP